MNVALAALVVVGFALIIEYLDLPGHARTAGRQGINSFQVFKDPSLKDHEKEEVLQRQAQSLLVLLGILVGGSVLAIALPLISVWFLTLLGVGSFAGTLAVLERADFLASATVLGLIVYLWLRDLHT